MRHARAFSVFVGSLVFPLLGSTAALAYEPRMSVHDWAQVVGFQDNWDNHYRRGRSLIAADFDGDGRVDYFLGNVGDPSVILRNVRTSPGSVRFEAVPVLPDLLRAFAAGAADYDNDGDLDLYVGCGGLEYHCRDWLLRNDSEPGRIRFSDVMSGAGMDPRSHATAGVAWGDYDRDGYPDLFLSDVRAPGGADCGNALWKNDGDGTFTDVTARVNLAYRPYGSDIVPMYRYQFQNSTWLDADNDGDLDLFLNNAWGPNVLYRNLLEENGVAVFRDETEALSLVGEDLHFPFFSFASAVADFNNDGWQDLLVFASGQESDGPYGNGHGLFLNQAGRGFRNVALTAGINTPGGGPESAMGCQVADLNADGIPDIVIGGGGPASGGRNRLLLSTGTAVGIPVYVDSSDLIDFEPVHGIEPLEPPFPEVPPFPYRTHGMAAADVDGDGQPELGVANGGLSRSPPVVREPNRLFHFSGRDRGKTLRVVLHGNGRTDGRDALGARAYVDVVTPFERGLQARERRRVYQTVSGATGFSAANEPALYFGLGKSGIVSRLAILWPSGCLQVLNGPFPDLSRGVDSGTLRRSRRTRSGLEVEQGPCWTCSGLVGSVAAWQDPDAYGCAPPNASRESAPP